jgi:hypothetical protein
LSGLDQSHRFHFELERVLRSLCLARHRSSSPCLSLPAQQGIRFSGASSFSHGSRDDDASRHAMVRAVEASLGKSLGILIDLQGLKLRVRLFGDQAATLHRGQTFTFDATDEPGDENRVFLSHPEIFAAVSPGDRLLDTMEGPRK